MIRAVGGFLRWVLSRFLIVAICGYQTFLRPLLPPLCRFQPSCSEYFIAAVQKHGPFRGAVKGLWRICRCNPLSSGGWDPP